MYIIIYLFKSVVKVQKAGSFNPAFCKMIFIVFKTNTQYPEGLLDLQVLCLAV